MAREIIVEGYWADEYAKLNRMSLELYTLAGTAATREFTLGGVTFRNTVRDGYFCLDQAITATGFDGDEGTDWKCIRQDKLA